MIVRRFIVGVVAVSAFELDDEYASKIYTVTAQRSGGPFFADGRGLFEFNYNPSVFPLRGGGMALAVRAQCGSHVASGPWGRCTVAGVANQAGASVVAVSRQISAPDEPLRFEPITSQSQVILTPDNSTLGKPDDDSHGTEDPRITFEPASKTYYMTYTCFSGERISYNLCWATCNADPMQASCWKRRGRMFPERLSTKSGSIMVRDSPPHYMFWGCFPIMAATNDDLTVNNWTMVNANDSSGKPTDKPKIIIPQRLGRFDAGVETGPAPVKLSDGNYLFIFNSVCTPGKLGCSPMSTVNTSVQYAPAFAILNGSDPTHVLQRSESGPLLTPSEPWELGTGNFSFEKTKGVVFAEGIHSLAPDKFLVFYGGADTVVGSAVVTVKMPTTAYARIFV